MAAEKAAGEQRLARERAKVQERIEQVNGVPGVFASRTRLCTALHRCALRISP